jgi:hypothetical protein
LIFNSLKPGRCFGLITDCGDESDSAVVLILVTMDNGDLVAVVFCDVLPCSDEEASKAVSLVSGEKLNPEGSGRVLHRILIQNLKQGIFLLCSLSLGPDSDRPTTPFRAFGGTDTARRAKSPESDHGSSALEDVFSRSGESEDRGRTHWMTAVSSANAKQ